LSPCLFFTLSSPACVLILLYFRLSFSFCSIFLFQFMLFPLSNSLFQNEWINFLVTIFFLSMFLIIFIFLHT
jgi:hypothetical protein